MKKKWFAVILTSIFLLAFYAENSMGGDLDDGISKFTDDSISKNDSMGKPDTNIGFIVLKATSKAKAKANANKKGGKGSKTSNYNDGSGDNNENSVVVGAGHSGPLTIYNINK
jgi:hypothetical protein